MRPITGRRSLFPTSFTLCIVSFLAVGIPSEDGVHRAYPVDEVEDTTGGDGVSGPAGVVDVAEYN